MTGSFTTRQDEANPVVCARNNFLFGHVLAILHNRLKYRAVQYGLAISKFDISVPVPPAKS